MSEESILRHLPYLFLAGISAAALVVWLLIRLGRSRPCAEVEPEMAEDAARAAPEAARLRQERESWESEHLEGWLDVAGYFGAAAIGLVGLVGAYRFPRTWWHEPDSPWAWVIVGVGALPILLPGIPERWAWALGRVLRRIYGVAALAVGAVVAIVFAWVALGALSSAVASMSLLAVGFVIIALLVLILIRQGRGQQL